MINHGYCSECGKPLVLRELDDHAAELHPETKIVYATLYRPTAEDLERMAAAEAALSPPQ